MRSAIRLSFGGFLVLAGWIVGSAQTPKGDFIIRIDAPSNGVINVECIEGCVALVGGRDIDLYREAQARTTYSYGPCRGTDRCGATFHGFIKK